MLLDEGMVDKHSSCAGVEKGGHVDGLQGGGGSELHGHVESMGRLRQNIYGWGGELQVVAEVLTPASFWVHLCSLMFLA